MDLHNINTIIWDWNGTLLNDVNHCIRSMNRLLKRRNLDHLCKNRYLDVFTFPVIEYYQKLGFNFDLEPFEIPAEEFIAEYNIGIDEIPLYKNTGKILDLLKRKKKNQYIVSAMKHEALIYTVKKRNIAPFFKRVSGIEDNLAFSKTTLAKRIIAEENLFPAQTLFIGDTLHDHEVATECGFQCVLIADGHQSRIRLEKAGVTVLDSLAELVNGMK